MIRYATLRLTPKIFPALTGLTLAEFERLAAGIRGGSCPGPCRLDSHQERHAPPPRRRRRRPAGS